MKAKWLTRVFLLVFSINTRYWYLSIFIISMLFFLQYSRALIFVIVPCSEGGEYTRSLCNTRYRMWSNVGWSVFKMPVWWRRLNVRSAFLAVRRFTSQLPLSTCEDCTWSSQQHQPQPQIFCFSTIKINDHRMISTKYRYCQPSTWRATHTRPDLTSGIDELVLTSSRPFRPDPSYLSTPISYQRIATTQTAASTRLYPYPWFLYSR